MAKIFGDKDADLDALDGRTVAIVGYGNQGRSQAQNLRDSGVSVVVGSPSDRSAERARADGFEVQSIAEAAASGDVVFLLVPDEVMPDVYHRSIAPGLNEGDAVVFASGYNVTFGQIEPPEFVDVLLLAPRMIGKGVRDTFERGTGFPSLIAVEQDASGRAHQTLLALAKGIGSTRVGAIESSFREETIVDLFSEQSGDLLLFQAMFEALVDAGVDPDVAIIELYGSGELAEMYAAARDMGLWGQLKLHSRTSQYGQQVVGRRYLDIDAVKDSYRKVLMAIDDGSFAEEWKKEYDDGLPQLRARTGENLAHAMQKSEDRLYSVLGRRNGELKDWIDESVVEE